MPYNKKKIAIFDKYKRTEVGEQQDSYIHCITCTALTLCSEVLNSSGAHRCEQHWTIGMPIEAIVYVQHAWQYISSY